MRLAFACTREVAKTAGLKRGRAQRILAEVAEVVADWPLIADEIGADTAVREYIRDAHRLRLPLS